MLRTAFALALLILSGTASAATVTGRVVELGARVAEYGVAIDFDPPIEVRAGDGRFTLDVREGRHRLTFVGWAFVNQHVDVEVPKSGTLDAGTITVEPGHHVDGTVIDSDGEPVENASILVFTEALPPGSPLELMLAGGRIATTNADGRFVIDGIPEDRREWRIAATQDDQRSIEQTLQMRGSVEVTIAREGTIRGTVANPKQLANPVVAANPVGNTGRRFLAGVNRLGQFELRIPAGVYDLALDDEHVAPLQVVVVADRISTAKLTAPTSRADLVVTAPDCILVQIFGTRAGDHLARTELGMDVCEHDAVTFTAMPAGAYRVCVNTDDDRCVAVTVKPSPRVQKLLIKPLAH